MERRPALLPVIGAALLAAAGLASAQPADDANRANPAAVVTAQRDGYTISALVAHAPGATAFKYAIALFPGYPGIMRLREEGGQPRFAMGGNFLVRSRRFWLDEETLVAVVDAPSDQWGSFAQFFRETGRYGADVAALLTEIGRRYKVEDWTLVGTSEGSVSAFQAARMNPQLARRVILTSSLFRPGRPGPGLSLARWEELKPRLLWVHHKDDPCAYTAYRDAVAYAEKTRAPLVTVSGGGPARGEPCEAFSQHGFIGVEQETVLAMRAWIKTGAVPADIAR